MKPGRVVLCLGGRYSGRKAVVVKVSQLDLLFLKFNKLIKYFN